MSDYYGLYGIFEQHALSVPRRRGRQEAGGFRAADARPRRSTRCCKPHREKLAAIDAEVKTARSRRSRGQEDARWSRQESGRRRRGEGSRRGPEEADRRRRRKRPTISNAYAVADGKPANAKMHLRGDPKRLGDEVPRHFPAILGGQELPAEHADQRPPATGRVAHRPAKNPLTARVMVNRIWQHHFGKGIVQTPNDFGTQGQPPTHPELLDYLASALHRKRLVGEGDAQADPAVATVAARQQSERAARRGAQARSEQRPVLEVQRAAGFDAESIRDTLLFVSGELDEVAGGAASVSAAAHLGLDAAHPVRRRVRDASPQRLPDAAAAHARTRTSHSSTAPIPAPAPACACRARRRCRRCS